MVQFLFLFLFCYAATQLAIQLHQERIQVVRSNREARKRPAESNSTPAMDHLKTVNFIPWVLHLRDMMIVRINLTSQLDKLSLVK